MARILVLQRQDSAVTYYRSVLPARALRALGHDVHFEKTASGDLKPTLSDWLAARLGQFDILLVDRGVTMKEIGGDPETRELGYHAFCFNSPAHMICDFDDDFTCVPKENQACDMFQPGQHRRMSGEAHLRLAEMTTVSTQVLADRFADYSHQIRLAPNCIDPADWAGPVNPDRDKDPHLRILYGGAAGHFGDLDAVRPGLEAVLTNPPCPIRLICFGTIPRWLHELRRRQPRRVVCVDYVPFFETPTTPYETYANLAAWGGFDIALAPLAQNRFNEAKSNIKFLEAAVQGIPFLASRVGPYATLPADVATTVPNTRAAWEDALTGLLMDAGARRAQAVRAREWALDQFSASRLPEIWREIIEATLAAPRITDLKATVVPAQLR